MNIKKARVINYVLKIWFIYFYVTQLFLHSHFSIKYFYVVIST
jgi:hypothetical protein